jgi:hypothetical protein
MRAACHGVGTIQDIDIARYFIPCDAIAALGATAKLPPPADFAGPFTLY